MTPKIPGRHIAASSEAAPITYGFLIRANSALVMSTFGLFLIPISIALSTDNKTIAGAFGLFSLVSGFSSPAVGGLVDRFGIRRVQRAGALLLMLGLLLSAAALDAWHYYIAMGVLCAAGVTAYTQVPINILITKLTHKRRLAAFGIVTSGAGIAGLIVVPLTAWCIDVGGWRLAYVLYAVLVLGTWLPFDRWVGNVELELSGTDRTPVSRHTWRQVVVRHLKLSRPEAQLVSMSFFSGLQRTMIVAFMIPWAVDHGYSVSESAQIFGVAEGARAIGGIAISFAGGRVGAKITYFFCTTVAAASTATMLAVDDVGFPALLAAGAMYGFASGGIHPSSSSLQSVVYHPSRLGLLFGLSSGVFGIGGGIAITIAGWATHYWSSLDAVIALVIVGLASMSLLVVGIPGNNRRGPKTKERDGGSVYG